MVGLTKSKASSWAAALAVLALVGGGAWVWASRDHEGSAGAQGAAVPGHAGAADVTAEDLAVVGRTRVFFGHQSVGMNMLDGVRAVYASHGVAAPPIDQTRSGRPLTGGWIAQDYIGANENPVSKIEDFDKAVRSGIGSRVEVAMMKFCYIDFTSETDVEALFAKYRDTISALKRDFPDVAFVEVTVPLTTEQTGPSKLKSMVTGNGRMGAGENVVRERFNALIRKEYSDDHLLDLAALESTTPTGSRVTGQHDGQQYFALYEGYAADSGHLNGEGSRRAGAAWVKAVAGAAK